VGKCPNSFEDVGITGKILQNAIEEGGGKSAVITA